MTGDNDAIWRMLKARRVAVVGASQDPKKFSGVLVPSILAGGFTGEVFPVNPKADFVAGLQAYPSVSDIPGSLDLVGHRGPRQVRARDPARSGRQRAPPAPS